jgi:5,5'-dehydrodivanillate O-demethylase oxygenase subunit
MKRQRWADLVDVGRDEPAGRFLRCFWQPIHASDALPVGRPRPLRVMDEEFTLYRGESGRVGLLAPRCPHRGTVLSVGRVEGDCLSCLYHGWTFDADGQCVDQPAEKRSFAQTTKIASYPVREYHGLIFAWFGADPPPEFPTFDFLDGEGLIQPRVETRPYPFFNQLENTVDEVHFNFVHRVSRFTDAGLNRHIPEVTCEETEYGIARYGKRGDAVRLTHVVMPNCTLTSVPRGNGWADRLAWRVPIDRNSHLSLSIDMIYLTGEGAREYRQGAAANKKALAELQPMDEVVDLILHGEMHLDDVADRPDLVLLQDTVAMRGQGLVDREADLLGASDRQVKLLRDIWTRELHKLDDSAPPKVWSHRADLQTTHGV